MQIDEQTIRSLLAEQNINVGITVQIDNLIIEKLTNGINAALLTKFQVEFLKDELLGLKEKYEENCGELDIELGRLVKSCKHPSWTKEENGLLFCNICGGIVKEKICAIQ